MANYTSADIRNIVLLGHAGAGKTSLAEAILHKTGITNRLGSVDDKTSILDADEEERERGHSIDSALAHVHYHGKVINLIDTPGYPDFLGAAICALAAAETAVIVVSAAAGIQINTRKLFQAAKDRGMACMIVINKIDSGMQELESLVNSLQESFGRECRCANLPGADGKSVIDCLTQESGQAAFGDVATAHTDLIETIIEADEELMESYLSGQEVSPEKLSSVFTRALITQTLVPIVFTSSRQEIGLEPLLDLAIRACPDPTAGLPLRLRSERAGETSIADVPCSAKGDPLGFVFRISYDPRSHIKYASVRLQRGVLKSDSNLQATGGKRSMRAGNLAKLQGDKLEPIEQTVPGDIITLAKLEELGILDTVFVGSEPGVIETPALPVPMYSLALEPKSRGDETKISEALSEVADADPTFRVERDRQTHELIVSALGELHVRVNLSRMHSRRGLEITTRPPEIPYRETITGTAKYVEYTHKKQSGGAGQFARVFIDLEPNERGAGYEFIDKIFGGSIDQPFRPSVDKGCQAAIVDGVIAGFPVVDVKVTLVDGKTHPVDSKDIAFQIAGREAFRKAFQQSNPILLEPIVNLEVTIPSENVGDITGDLAGRRGRVQGQEVLAGGMAAIKAQVPLAELQQYNSQLKSVTGGQGSYSMELSHYEPVPPNVTQQIIARRKQKKEEEK
ncbi:MAG: elongation factor G [Sedimentisphaerales bacterium]|nr:elongation factor G [Sedimentisphaerales bacterium]